MDALLANDHAILRLVVEQVCPWRAVQKPVFWSILTMHSYTS